MAFTFTQAQIDEFKAAMLARKGAITMAFADQSVTFETYERQIAFLAFMERNIESGPNPGRARFAATSKGV